jgi:LacI family transcriptional regulator
MDQLARELDLCRMTVSSVVNGRYRERGIPEATAERVRVHLAARGYVPSRSAVDLRTGVRDALGILYGGRLYSHLIEAFNELVGGYNESGRRLETLVVGEDGVAAGLRELIARGVSQLIWVHRRAPASEIGESGDVLGYLGHVQTVIYNYRFEDPSWDERLDELGVCRVGVDREAGFRRLGEMLVRLGHRTVAVGHEREGAEFVRAPQGLRAAGLEVRFVAPAEKAGRDPSPAYAAALADMIVAAMRRQGITACALLDDSLAGMVMVELLRRGVRIPDDLTLTGFDGMPFTAFTPVGLTTLAVPTRRMVEAVGRALATDGETVRRFELDLVERDSHGAPRKEGR